MHRNRLPHQSSFKSYLWLDVFKVKNLLCYWIVIIQKYCLIKAHLANMSYHLVISQRNVSINSDSNISYHFLFVTGCSIWMLTFYLKNPQSLKLQWYLSASVCKIWLEFPRLENVLLPFCRHNNRKAEPLEASKV